MAHVIADDAVAVRRDHRLDGGADVGDPVADDHRADSRLQALARHFQELVRLCRHLPDRDGARRVAVPAPYHGAMVELHQIAVQKLPLARDAVDHLVVDGDADVLGEAVQVLEGASGPALLGFALGGLVQLLEGDPRLDQLLQLLEHPVDDEPRLAHYGDLVGSLQLDAHYDAALHFVGGAHALDGAQDSTRFVVVGQGRCLVFVLGQAAADCLGLVVRALDERRVVPVAEAGPLGRVGAQVVDRAVLRAIEAPAQAVDQDVCGNVQVQHVVDLAAAARQHLVERGGLGDGAGKAVEQEPAFRLGAGERLVDDAVHHLVRDELARVHQRVGLLAQRRPIGDGAAQDVAGGELRDRESPRQALRLRAFPRSRWTQEDEIEHASGPRRLYAAAGAPVTSRRPRMRGPRGPVKPS